MDQPFDAYEILSLLGEGGMGRVYVARQRRQEPDKQSLVGILGVWASCPYESRPGRHVVPEFRLRYLHDFESDNRGSSAALAGLPGVNFAIAGNSLSRDSVQVGAGVSVQVTDRFDLFASYDGVLANRSETHVAEAGARLAF